MRSRTPRHQPVATMIAVEVSNHDGKSAQVAAQLSYDPRDPFAVTVTFRDGRGPIPWTFARELLADGVYSPVGEGDVHVWPCLSVAGEAVVMLELASEEGSVLVQAPARAVVRFVADTQVAVPAGHELEQYDVDAALTGILA